MTVSTAEKSRQLLNTRDELMEFLSVCRNYDSKIHAIVGSFHNHNRKVYVERKIELPESIKSEIEEMTQKKIDELEAELEDL